MDIYDNTYKGRMSPTFTPPRVRETKPERERCIVCGMYTRVSLSGLCYDCDEHCERMGKD